MPFHGVHCGVFIIAHQGPPVNISLIDVPDVYVSKYVFLQKSSFHQAIKALLTLDGHVEMTKIPPRSGLHVIVDV